MSFRNDVFFFLIACLLIFAVVAAEAQTNTSMIGGLPPAGTITGSELVPLEQLGITKKATTSQLTLGSMVLGVPSGGTGLTSVGPVNSCLTSNGVGLFYGPCGGGGGGGGGTPGGSNGQIQFNNAGAFGGYNVGAGLAVIGNDLVSTSTSGASPSGLTGAIQINGGGGLFGSIPNANSAFLYLTNNGTTPSWSNPASLVDPRTYGASCVGPGYTGGLSSSNQGILLVAAGSGYVDGTYTAVPLTGGAGSGAQATIVVLSGAVTTVTITTAGSGYKLRDQLSASNFNLGGSGSGFIAQVAHFNANHTPVYDGVHDDTAAFQNAMAVAQNTGQAVLVPNGCWVSSLNVPQGIVMVGEGYAVTYSFNMLGGTADAMPVLYLENAPTFGLHFNANPNDAFIGFEINAAAQGNAFNVTYCLGTDQNSGGGSTKIWAWNMAYKGCRVGLGTNNGSTVFAISQNSDFGSTQFGIFGNMSDLYSIGDTFDSTGTGIFLSGGAGEVRIESARFEFSNIGLDVEDYGGVKCNNCEFDHLAIAGVKLGSSSNNVSLTGGSFQHNGDNAVSGQESHILIARNVTTPLVLNISNVLFSTENSAFPKYVIESTVAGTNADYININGGSVLSGYSVDMFNWQNGAPQHLQVENVTGAANQGVIANGSFPSQARGLPSNSWSNLAIIGDPFAFNNQLTPLKAGFGGILSKNMGAGTTYFVDNSGYSHFDCDDVNSQVFPNTNPLIQNNAAITWLANPADVTFGAGFYQNHLIDTQSCLLAGMSWMAIPQKYKVYGQASSCVKTGSGWSNSSAYGGTYGVVDNTNGDSLACTIATYGGPIYVWYQMNGSNGGTFDINVNGGANTAVATQGQGSFTFPIGTTSFSVGAIRIPSVPIGTQNVVNVAVTSSTSASNTVNILGVGTTPNVPLSGSSPSVFFGGELFNASFPTVVTAFNTAERSIASQLSADGLSVNFVNVQSYLNSTDFSGSAGGPFNGSGQNHLADAFSGVMQYAPIAGNIVNPINFGASCNAQLFVGNNFNGGGLNGLRTTSGSNIISINNYVFQSGTATQNGGGDVGKQISMSCSSGEVGPTTYIASVMPLGTSAVIGYNSAITCSGAGNTGVTMGGYPTNPNDPSTAQDDTIAIQNAAKAAQLNGGQVFLPPNCLVHNLTLPNNTRLQGNVGGFNYNDLVGHPNMSNTPLYAGMTGFADDIDTKTGVARNMVIAADGADDVALVNMNIICPNFPFSFANLAGAAVGHTAATSISPEHILMDNVTISQCPVGWGPPAGWTFPVTFTGSISGNVMTVTAVSSTNFAVQGFGSDFLAVGRTVTGAGVPANETITGAPVGLGTGNYTVSIGTTISSETLTSPAAGRYTSGTLLNSLIINNGMGMNGDFTDTRVRNTTFTNNYQFEIYMGPNGGGAGNGSNTIMDSRLEDGGVGLVCDGCGVQLGNVEVQFEQGACVVTSNAWSDVLITGGFMYGCGAHNAAAGDKAQFQLGGNGSRFSVNGTGFTKTNVVYGGNSNYIFETMPSATVDYISIEGGDVLNGFNIAPYNFASQTPVHYKQNSVGLPLVDTTQSIISIGTSGNVGIGTSSSPNSILSVVGLGTTAPIGTSATPYLCIDSKNNVYRSATCP